MALVGRVFTAPAVDFAFKHSADSAMKSALASLGKIVAKIEQIEGHNVSSSPDEEEMTQAILGYLAEHPQAMDTIEGIAEWWLMRQQVRVSMTMLSKVLQRLTESGAIEELRTGDTRQYRRRR
jgi:hypothetical protein